MLIRLVLLFKLCSMVSSKVITVDIDPNEITDESQLNIDDAPYIVSVHNIIAGGGYENVCTGFLIDPYWILTSAHCFDGGKVTKTMIKFSVNDYSLNTTNIVQAKLIIKHPEYNNLSLINDLTLINVPFPIWYAKRAVYIMSDEIGFKWKREVLERRKCLSIGYGKINYKDPLLYVKALTASYDPKACGCFATNPELLCATPMTSNSGVCFDDVGGPLICNGLLVGVANRVLRCSQQQSDNCSEETYYRYTYLCAYFQWISDYVDSFPDKCSGFKPGLLSSTFPAIPAAIHIILMSILIIFIL